MRIYKFLKTFQNMFRVLRFILKLTRILTTIIRVFIRFVYKTFIFSSALFVLLANLCDKLFISENNQTWNDRFQQWQKEIRLVFEKLGNLVELAIFRSRNLLIFAGIAICIVPFFSLVRSSSINNLNQIYSQVCTPLQAFFGSNFLTTNVATIGIVVVLWEIISRLRKKFTFQLENTPPSERVFALVPYFWLWLEFTGTYFDFIWQAMEDWATIDQQMQFYDNFTAIFSVYNSLPGSQWALPGYAIFFLFYFGIGRNKETFSFFVRYHFVNSILVGALLSYISHLFFLFMRHQNSPDLANFLGSGIYGIALIAIFIGCVSSILGREAKIPFVHPAVSFHVGRKEDRGSSGNID